MVQYNVCKERKQRYLHHNLYRQETFTMHSSLFQSVLVLNEYLVISLIVVLLLVSDYISFSVCCLRQVCIVVM